MKEGELNRLQCRNSLKQLKPLIMIKKKSFQKISKHYNVYLKRKKLALQSLSFKANTDDMGEAPSRVLIEALWKAGAKVQTYGHEQLKK